jgi:hypothetical protein
LKNQLRALKITFPYADTQNGTAVAIYVCLIFQLNLCMKTCFGTGCPKRIRGGLDPQILFLNTTLIPNTAEIAMATCTACSIFEFNSKIPLSL